MAWASGRGLLFTEIGQAVGRVGFIGEDQEFSFEIPVRQPNGERSSRYLDNRCEVQRRGVTWRKKNGSLWYLFNIMRLDRVRKEIGLIRKIGSFRNKRHSNSQRSGR